MSRLLLAALAAGCGAAINSIAGGGTLVTFPAIVALGLPPIVANATSTVALLPGVMGSIWGYRRALSGARQWIARWAIPSLLGGTVGAILLLKTPAPRFSAIVPWLVLGATALFVAQKPLLAVLRQRGATHHAAEPSGDPTPGNGVIFYQFLVGVYGGYFGAGIGILMLAALGFMGFTNIHRMNGLKNWGGLTMNGVAAAIFAGSALVNWQVAGAMAVGAAVGGYVGSRTAQRVPQQWVRRAIVLIGFASGAWMLVRR